MTDASFIVVGAGIVGLSTAYHLTRRGAGVTVIERGPIPNPLAASCDHHRLIRLTYPDKVGYAARMLGVLDAWREMWGHLPGPQRRYYADVGMLTVSQEEGDYTDRARRTMDILSIPYERIDSTAELAERFPFLEVANLAYGVLSEGGALMANHIITDLADWLRAEGATLLEYSPATAIDETAGTVILADGRTLGADRVIVSTGIETGRLIPDLAGTLTLNRSLVVYADPPEDLVDAWRDAPCWNDLGGASHLWGMPPVDGLPAKFGNAATGTRPLDDADRTITPEEIGLVLSDYRGRLRGIERFRVRYGAANFWTRAPEERFFLEERGRSLVVSACSGHGFKFGALSGRDVADAATAAETVSVVAHRMAGLEQEPAAGSV
ncbi:FAD-dependent oxidoreductase [Acuticoccus mangrovi]|uniref:FAD-dependent oxidoreductase n=1 Tax=Acuticoccus mangrovi TaxID=2796142 RepID=A0A934MJ39_9HYPH|nr:FAD-dependent oxidoreductase [Acuticoccus mangrovi]MBJ3774209.1 FAD-dependent oxidoreductase [Acuticoccus mangrovi]